MRKIIWAAFTLMVWRSISKLHHVLYCRWNEDKRVVDAWMCQIYKKNHYLWNHLDNPILWLLHESIYTCQTLVTEVIQLKPQVKHSLFNTWQNPKVPYTVRETHLSLFCNSGNNLDQSFKKKTRASPAAGCRAPSKAVEAAGAAGAAGTSGLNQQRNITRQDTTDPDLPPTYSVSYIWEQQKLSAL